MEGTSMALVPFCNSPSCGRLAILARYIVNPIHCWKYFKEAYQVSIAYVIINVTMSSLLAILITTNINLSAVGNACCRISGHGVGHE